MLSQMNLGQLSLSDVKSEFGRAAAELQHRHQRPLRLFHSY